MRSTPTLSETLRTVKRAPASVPCFTAITRPSKACKRTRFFSCILTHTLTVSPAPILSAARSALLAGEEMFRSATIIATAYHRFRSASSAPAKSPGKGTLKPLPFPGGREKGGPGGGGAGRRESCHRAEELGCIDFIADHRMPNGFEVHANLVGASRAWNNSKHRVVAEALAEAIFCQRLACFLARAHGCPPAAHPRAADGRIDTSLFAEANLYCAIDECAVDFLNKAIFKLLFQMLKCLLRFSYRDNPACLAVKPMHESRPQERLSMSV